MRTKFVITLVKTNFCETPTGAYAGYGTLQCYPDYGAGRCPGAANSNCYPYVVWSSKLVGDSNAWSPELNGGRFYEYVGEAGHAKTNAFTVRCVLDVNLLKKKCEQLCDGNAGYGTLQCYIGISSCPGAANDRCYPYIVWSAKQFGDGSTTWAPELNSGRFYSWNGEDGRSSLNAVTVRCVLDVDCIEQGNAKIKLCM